MTEPARIEAADAPHDQSGDTGTLIASLRTAGANKFDPIRWHYIEALVQRAATHHGSIRNVLDTKLMQALITFKERFDLAQREAKEIAEQHAQQYPQAASELQQLLDAGDFKTLRRLAATLKSNEQDASLSALIRQLEQHATDNINARTETIPASRPELKAIRQARNTWSKLSVDKQVAQALEQAPKNAGPINSHMLVLRSLQLMRDISPDYLNRFISYAETLLCLDQGEKEKAEKEKPATPKKSSAKKAAKK